MLKQMNCATQFLFGNAALTLIAVLAFLIFMPSAASASCTADLPDRFSELEQEVWDSLCETGTYDGAISLEKEEETEGEVCETEEVLSADFMSTILTTPEFYTALPSRSISLSCQDIEALDLVNAVTPVSMRFSDLAIRNGANLRYMSLDGNLDFKNVFVGADVNVQGAEIDGFLRFTDSDLNDIEMFELRATSHVSFYRSQVDNINAESVVLDSYFNIIDSTIRGHLGANNARVDDLFDLRRSTFTGTVNLSDAFARLGLVGSDAIFYSDLDARRFSSSNSLGFLRTVFEGDADFRWARAYREVNFSGAKALGTLDLKGAVVPSINDFDGGEFKTIDLGDDAEVGHATFFDATITDKLNLAYSKVQGLHFAASGDDPRLTKWGESSEFTLGHSNIQFLAASFPQSFVRSDGSNLPINLNDSHIESFDLIEAEPTSTTGPKTMTDWIVSSNEAIEADTGHFSPRPFEQVENWYRSSGDYEAARRVAYEQMSERTRALPHSAYGWLQRIFWFWPSKVVVGFGAYPLYAVLWFLGLVGLGWAAGYRYGDPRPKNGWFWCRYSFDNSIPLLETSAETRDVQHRNGYLSGGFLIQKVFGFVLVSIVIGSLTFQ